MVERKREIMANLNIELITIDKSKYDQLLDDSLLLNALQIAGVDNWCGYDEALREYREMVVE